MCKIHRLSTVTYQCTCTNCNAFYRSVTNVSKKTTPATATADLNGTNNNNNDENNRPGTSGGGGGGDEHPGEAETEGYNAENYDSRQARKRSKKRDQSDSFQERLLKAIEAPPPPPPEQVPSDSSIKREYIDVAFEAMSFKIKRNSFQRGNNGSCQRFTAISQQSMQREEASYGGCDKYTSTSPTPSTRADVCRATRTYGCTSWLF